MFLSLLTLIIFLLFFSPHFPMTFFCFKLVFLRLLFFFFFPQVSWHVWSTPDLLPGSFLFCCSEQGPRFFLGIREPLCWVYSIQLVCENTNPTQVSRLVYTENWTCGWLGVWSLFWALFIAIFPGAPPPTHNQHHIHLENRAFLGAKGGLAQDGVTTAVGHTAEHGHV